MLASVRLDEKSAAACAVTTWRDQLYLAWTGTDMHINVASSVDGREIMGKQRLAEVSYKRVTKSSSGTNQSSTTQTVALAPALAGSGARLCLAWTGSDGALNVLGAEHPDYPRPVTFKERTAESPSLTTTEPGDLAVAWTGTDRHVNLLTVAEDLRGRRRAWEAPRAGSTRRRAITHPRYAATGPPDPGLDRLRPPHQPGIRAVGELAHGTTEACSTGSARPLPAAAWEPSSGPGAV
jgi:hypothetical protein